MDMDTGSNPKDPFEGTWKLNFAKSDLRPLQASGSPIARVQVKGSDPQIETDPVPLDGELKAAGISPSKVAPMLLPDYSNPAVRKRQLTTDYHGTLRE